MRKIALLAALLLASVPAVHAAPARAIRRIDGTKISAADADRTIAKLVDAAHITGLNVAIVNDGKVVYLRSFGMRNVERGEPLTPTTVMSAASLTKAAFAYLCMQLVDDGKLDLDMPVYRYLDKPFSAYEKWADLANDERAKQITARMLLSHTAGFPNFRWIDEADGGKLLIKFTPGSRYAYSGEGINLMGFVVESITKRPLGDLMQERVFTPLGMTQTSMTWQPRFEANYAIGYDEQGKPLGVRKRSVAGAAGSMATTAEDYAKFLGAVMQRKGLSRAAWEEMTKAQIAIRSVTQFPTLRPETTTENDAIHLEYALGWGTFTTPYGKAVFKEGHDDGWENHAVIYPQAKVAILLMSNSANGDAIYAELLRTLVADRFTPAKWEGYAP